MSEVRDLFDKRSWSLVEDFSVLELGNSDASLGEWRGMKALHLKKTGGAVFINNEFHLESFRIQALVAIPEAIGFIGLVFGARNSANYELIYLSPVASNGTGEIQYDPVMNGSTTWQIYNGSSYVSYTRYNVGDWVKLTIDVHEQSATVYVGDDFSTPQLIISKLQHGEVFGKIGVWGYLPVYIRDLSIEGIPSISHSFAERKKEEFINEWLVSEPYSFDSQPNELSWIAASTEENGTLNINRLFSSENEKVVQIKSSLTLSSETKSHISFGYSDELRLWINEEEVYHGLWMWDPPKNDGRIRSDHVTMPIIWRKGVNTIRAELISKETVFGWGICLKAGVNY